MISNSSQYITLVSERYKKLLIEVKQIHMYCIGKTWLCDEIAPPRHPLPNQPLTRVAQCAKIFNRIFLPPLGLSGLKVSILKMFKVISLGNSFWRNFAGVGQLNTEKTHLQKTQPPRQLNPQKVIPKSPKNSTQKTTQPQKSHAFQSCNFWGTQ